MRLSVAREGGGDACDVEWDERAGYTALVGAVFPALAGPEATLADNLRLKGLYYTDTDGDRIAIHSQEDVDEFVDHIACQPHGTAPALTAVLHTPQSLEPRQPLGQPPSPPRRPSLQTDTAHRDAGHNPSSPARATNRRQSTQPIRSWGKGQMLGSGSSGKVYLGIDHDTGDLFAVKEILFFGCSDQNTRNAKREIELMRPLAHTNIVRYLGAQETSTSLHVMMEYVPGGSISNLLAKLGAFGEHVIRLYTIQICAGLQYLHEMNILHRDIKGGNCLVGLDGTVKLADFGCSVNLGTSGALGSDAAAENVTGTSLWMSPETVKCGSGITLASDIWSLGCTIVEMGSGRPPWDDAKFVNEWAAMYYISTATSGPPIPRTLSRQAHDWLYGCFRTDSNERATLDDLLAHPFLTLTFNEQSADPGMKPPLLSELRPQPVFPSLGEGGASVSRDGAEMVDTVCSGDACFTPLVMSSSEEGFDLSEPVCSEPLCTDGAYRSLASPYCNIGSPIDGVGGAGFGQADSHSAMPGSATTTTASTAAAAARVSLLPNLPGSAFRVAGGAAEGGGAAPSGESPHPGVGALSLGLSDTALSQQLSCSVVSNPLEITDFLKSGDRSDAGKLQPPTAHPTPKSGDRPHPALPVANALSAAASPVGRSQNAGLSALAGLPDGVVYMTLYFLDYVSLCTVASCSSMLNYMVDSGRNEIVWRKVFTQEFGPTSVIQASLRRSWKPFVAQSVAVRRECRQNPRVTFTRKITNSPKIYEGVCITGDDTAESVVLKIERRSHSTTHSSANATLGTIYQGSIKPLSFISGTVCPSSAPQDDRGTPHYPTGHRTSIPQEGDPLGDSGRGGGAMGSTPVLKPVVTPPKRNVLGSGRGLRPSPALRPHHVRGMKVTSPSQKSAMSPPERDHAGGLVSPPLNFRITHLQPLGKAGEGGDGVAKQAELLPLPEAVRPVEQQQQQQQDPPHHHSNAEADPKMRCPVPPLESHDAEPKAKHPAARGGDDSVPPLRGGGGGALPSPALPHPVFPLGKMPLSPPAYSGSGGVGGPHGQSPLHVGSTPSGGVADRHPAPLGYSSASLPGSHPPSVLGHQPGEPFALRGAGVGEAVGDGGGPLAGGFGFVSSASSMASLTTPSSGGAGAGGKWSSYEYTTELDRTEQRKREERRDHSSLLMQDYRFLRALSDAGVEGVLHPIWIGPVSLGGTALALPKAGPSLNDLLLFSGNRFSCKTVCLIALRVLKVLEAVHREGIVHGNIAPSNVLLRSADPDVPASSVVLVNFSSARVWRDRKTMKVTSARSSPKIRSKEQLFFASVHVQMECTSSPRDDLVSLAYMLFFFYHGQLPWLPVNEQAFRPNAQRSKEIIARKKKFLNETKNHPPLQLHHFLRYTSLLRANQAPDYPLLVNLFKVLLGDKGSPQDPIIEPWTGLQPYYA